MLTRAASRWLQVYTRLSERLNMNDHLMVLNIMLGKIAVNLKVYSSSEDVIQQTLSLFQARLHSLGCSIPSPACLSLPWKCFCLPRGSAMPSRPLACMLGGGLQRCISFSLYYTLSASMAEALPHREADGPHV